MDSVARFSTSFVGKVIASGSKVQGSAFPTLTVASTKDKFVLNSKSLGLMGLDEGSNVVMLDMNKGAVVTDDPNARWYLTKGYDKGKGQIEGAKIGKGGGYSYAGIYSAIVMNKSEISEASVKDMVAADKGILRKTKEGTPDEKESFIGKQKTTFKVSKLVQPGATEGDPDQTEFEVSTGIFQPVYALTEMEVTAHTPRSAEEEEAGEPAAE